MIIALGAVAESSLAVQIIAVSFVALVATIGVYGVVALLVRMDDFGLYLLEKNIKAGAFLIKLLPKVIRGISIIGTIALLLVSGGIFSHYIPWIHEKVHNLPNILGDLIVGIAIGFAVLLPVILFKGIFKKAKPN